MLATGDTLAYCPQAATFAKALGTAARNDNGQPALSCLGENLGSDGEVC